MKKTLFKTLLVVSALLTLTKCKKSDNERLELIQITKFISAEAMRNLPIGVSIPAKAMKTGKIYVYKDLLFINEPYKGIHVYDNKNPSIPVNKAFLHIPGNIDIAISNNILYADSYIDLLAFDISNMASIKQVKRVNDVFKQFYARGLKKYVKTYKDTLVKANTYQNKDNFFTTVNSFRSFTGQGGSMARFTLLNKHLYTVGDFELNLFDVKTATKPSFVKSINLGWGVETFSHTKTNYL